MQPTPASSRRRPRRRARLAPGRELQVGDSAHTRILEERWRRPVSWREGGGGRRRHRRRDGDGDGIGWRECERMKEERVSKRQNKF